MTRQAFMPGWRDFAIFANCDEFHGVRMKSLVLATLAFASFASMNSAQAQSSPPDAAMNRLCATQVCQQNVRVSLSDGKGQTYSKVFARLPAVVQGDYFTVTAGQTVYLEAYLQGDKLTGYRQVQSIQKPAQTITASLKQLPDSKMQLQISNPFARNVKFQVGALALGSKSMVKAQSCPILAAKTGAIIWDKPVLQAAVGFATALAPNAKFECTE